jgi:hypothetical protein
MERIKAIKGSQTIPVWGLSFLTLNRIRGKKRKRAIKNSGIQISYIVKQYILARMQNLYIRGYCV